MQTVTLEELMSSVRSRVDMPSGGFIDDVELVRFINSGARRLYGMLVKLDLDAYLKSQALTLAPDRVNLPSDFFKLGRVEVLVDGVPRALRRYNVQDDLQRSPHTLSGLFTVGQQSYQLRGQQLFCTPNPPPYPNVTIWYAPDTWCKSAGGTAQRALVQLTDYIDCVNGWDDLIVLEAGIKCLQKEESAWGELAKERDRLLEEIRAEADDRDAAQPRTAIDVRSDDWSY